MPWRTSPRVCPISSVPRGSNTTVPSALKVSVEVMQRVISGSVESIAVSRVQSMNVPLASSSRSCGSKCARVALMRVGRSSACSLECDIPRRGEPCRGSPAVCSSACPPSPRAATGGAMSTAPVNRRSRAAGTCCARTGAGPPAGCGGCTSGQRASTASGIDGALGPRSSSGDDVRGRGGGMTPSGGGAPTGSGGRSTPWRADPAVCSCRTRL